MLGRRRREKERGRERTRDRIVDAEVVESHWSIPKISIGVVIILLLIGYFFYSNKAAREMFLPTTITHQSVKGAQTEKVATQSGSKINLQQKVDEIKKEIQHIDVVDVTTNSPQVQKVMNDLKALQGVPGNEVKSLCENICKGL